MHVLSALLFAVSANIDCLAIGLSYGIQSVKIDARSNLIIAVISTAGTLISMLAGKPLAALCSADTANRIGAVLLMLIGCWILFQNHRTQQKSLKAYDRDASSRIDQKEAVVLAFALTKLLHLPDGIALGLILVGCCPGGVSSNIMSYLCGGDVAFSVGMTTVSTLVSPVMTPLMVSFLARGTQITIKGLPMFVSIIETVILPVGFGFLLNYLYGKKKMFHEIQQMMPGVAVLGLACVVGGVVSSQGSKFFQSGVVIFVAVLLHNGLGYLFGYGAGKLVGMNTSKKRTIAIEVGMQNAGLATNLATTTAQFASTPESAIICAVSCTWHSISGTLLAGLFAMYDKKKEKAAGKVVTEQ